MRIFLVDDSVAFLEAATAFLSTAPGVEIVGRALSGREALAQVTQLRPDVVLLDVVMPDMNGLETTQRIKAEAHAPRVIILTLHDDLEYRIAAKTVGADGFVSKAAFGTQLLPLLQALFTGDAC
jgi:DNA-binding NarL/FixJ family response regulator